MLKNFKKSALHLVFIERFNDLKSCFEGHDFLGFFLFPARLYTSFVLIVYAFFYTLIQWMLSWFGGTLNET